METTKRGDKEMVIKESFIKEEKSWRKVYKNVGNIEKCSWYYK